MFPPDRGALSSLPAEFSRSWEGAKRPRIAAYSLPVHSLELRDATVIRPDKSGPHAHSCSARRLGNTMFTFGRSA